MLAPLRDALRAWRVKVEQVRPVEPDDLVFPASKGGMHARGYTWRFAKAWAHVEKVLEGNVPEHMVFYCLRHTCGSLLLLDDWVERGWLHRRMSMAEVSTLLGHSNISVTSQHYARLSDESVALPVVAPAALVEPALAAPGATVIKTRRPARRIHWSKPSANGPSGPAAPNGASAPRDAKTPQRSRPTGSAVEPLIRVELMTYGLRNRCSTN